ncbi:MAG TPA: hypothetical protein PKC21_01600 [Oligoflexia bacterium]|nr:hypothetical protein [Oligoflexia bacterium]HMR24026.1 hypothetical protein [Oligoflexia bacterium]
MNKSISFFIFIGLIICLQPLIAAENKEVVKVVKFKKSIEITKDHLNIDDETQIKVKCYTGDKNKYPFAKIVVGENIKIPIYCEKDYLGGIFLEIKNSEDVDKIELFQQDGDAGEMWDTRAWITKDKDIYEILKITLGSYLIDDDVMSDKRNCETSYQFFTWNEKNKNFDYIQKKIDPSFIKRKFKAPITVDDVCLNKKGLWEK